MIFALDKDGNRIHISDAIAIEEYYCPVCGASLIQRKGEVRQHHFAHRTDCICTDSWAGQYDMSEWHYGWQEKFPAECREVVCYNSSEKHRADVLIGKTVIEFQHSPLSTTDFARRNNFYRSLGYKVIWLFDCVDAYYHEGRIEQIGGSNEQYKWANPIHTLDEFSPRYDGATVYLQMEDDSEDSYGDTGCISILKLNWVSPDGMRRFCAREWFSETEFLRSCGLTIANSPLTPANIFDRLIQTRDIHNNYCYSTCVQSKSMLVPFENCLPCKFRTDSGCIARFQNLDLSSVSEISKIERDLDGRILRIDAMCGEESISFNFPALRSVAKPLTDLWNEFKPLAVARFKNLRNGYEVQLSRDPNEMADKYGRCYGKLCRPGGDFDKESSQVYDWDKPYWVITWFKRSYQSRRM